jgi:hypothetical protein
MAVKQHIAAHCLELIEEVRPACEEAQAQAQHAIDWLKKSQADWTRLAQRVDDYVQATPGMRANPLYRVPSLQFASQLASVLEPMDGNVPLPIPWRLLDQSERIAELKQQLDAYAERYGEQAELPAEASLAIGQLQAEIRSLERVQARDAPTAGHRAAAREAHSGQDRLGGRAGWP